MLKKILFTVHNSLDCLARQSRKSAFTLAETLIVMGIIGVVAALTLPNLNSSTGDKEKVAKLQKIYSNLNDAFARAQAVYGPFDEWGISQTNSDSDCEKFGERLTEFMKISKNCATDYNGGCKTNGDYPHEFNGRNASGGEDGYSFILADGASMELIAFGVAPYIFVDIDGPNKGPYASGKDVFVFSANQKYGFENGFMPGLFTDNKPEDPTRCPASAARGFDDGCTAWVIQYGNMDYTKIGSDKKCKNNPSIILDGVSNITCK